MKAACISHCTCGKRMQQQSLTHPLMVPTCPTQRPIPPLPPFNPTLQEVKGQRTRRAAKLHQFGLIGGVLLCQQALPVRVVVGTGLTSTRARGKVLGEHMQGCNVPQLHAAAIPKSCKNECLSTAAGRHM